MISFDLNPEQKALKECTEAFVLGKILPYEKDARNTAHGPTEDLRIELNALAKEAGLFEALCSWRTSLMLFHDRALGCWRRPIRVEDQSGL